MMKRYFYFISFFILVLLVSFVLIPSSDSFVVESGSVTPQDPPPNSSGQPGDVVKVDQLENPPKVVRAIYLTSWSAGSERKMAQVINLINETEINSVVIDIKDYTGLLSYDSQLEMVNEYGLEDVKINNLSALLKRLHDNNIYAIARVAVFQDPAMAEARSDLAVRSSSTGEVWRDRKGLAWIDPASREMWEYVAGIGKEAYDLGFDEINFDYIRFPTDGDVSNTTYPFWQRSASMNRVIHDFFGFLGQEMGDIPISADLFGLTTINRSGLGIGQVIEDAYKFFDYVAPMVYPSHYARGALGFVNPAANPYEVVFESIDTAFNRLQVYRRAQRVAPAEMGYSTSSPGVKVVELNSLEEADFLVTANKDTEVESRIEAKLRPWLQDFSLQDEYGPDRVRAQIRAVKDVLGSEYAGYMLWDPTNTYTREALVPEEGL